MNWLSGDRRAPTRAEGSEKTDSGILGAGGHLSDAVAEVTVHTSGCHSMAWSNVGLSAG